MGEVAELSVLGVVAADTNAIHALFEGKIDDKTNFMRRAFDGGRLLLPPPL